jgi:hypothetical protein
MSIGNTERIRSGEARRQSVLADSPSANFPTRHLIPPLTDSKLQQIVAEHWKPGRISSTEKPCSSL